MKRKVFLCLLFLICILSAVLTGAFAAEEWSEADFAFYDTNMEISEKPTAGSEWTSSYINLKNKEDGQTYRGIRVGSYSEQLMQKYDFSDAEWSIYDTSKDAVRGKSERSENLIQKWEEEGKTGADVLAMSDFLCSKGYYFYINIDVYRYEGQFVTRSKINIEPDEIKDEIRNTEIESLLNRSSSSTTREEAEKWYDDYVAKQGDAYYDYAIENYIQRLRRANFQFRIENGVVTIIELSDYYYSSLKQVYNDDGTINESYAYVLDLK